MVDPKPLITPHDSVLLPSHDEIRSLTVPTGAGMVELTDDPYSDRIRCDHPDIDDARALGQTLIEAADELGRGRIVALVDADETKTLQAMGFEIEAIMPGFYEGERDCAVMGTAETSARMEPADAAASQLTEEILEAKRTSPGLHVAIETELATPNDAAEIAALLDETFAEYPTPTGDAEYISRQLSEGTMFRVYREDDQIVACASADLVASARTAEVTDCATRPAHRGNGYMRTIIAHLLDDLAAMNYPTAFTLARARVPGVNIAFQRCGFELRGTMAQSCRIGTGLEDMNVWSRSL